MIATLYVYVYVYALSKSLFHQWDSTKGEKK